MYEFSLFGTFYRVAKGGKFSAMNIALPFAGVPVHLALVWRPRLAGLRRVLKKQPTS